MEAEDADPMEPSLAAAKLVTSGVAGEGVDTGSQHSRDIPQLLVLIVRIAAIPPLSRTTGSQRSRESPSSPGRDLLENVVHVLEAVLKHEGGFPSRQDRGRAVTGVLLRATRLPLQR